MTDVAFLYELVGRIDDQLAGAMAGGGFWIVIPLALALGLRHATDPDHVVAVGALLGADRPAARGAMRLGAWWGAGHAATLVALGLPLIALESVPPGWVARGFELAIAALIVVLSLRALVHRHLPPGRRTRWGAAAIGVAHGLAGTGAIVLLLLASIPDTRLAAVALLVFAPMSVLSMAACSGAVGWALGRSKSSAVDRATVPVLALVGVLFGVGYGLSAV